MRDTLIRKFCIHSSDMDRFSLKTVWQKSYSASFNYWELFRSFLFTIIIRRQTWVTPYSPRFRKYLLGFSSFLIQLRLLLILILFTFLEIFLHVCLKKVRDFQILLVLFLKNSIFILFFDKFFWKTLTKFPNLVFCINLSKMLIIYFVLVKNTFQKFDFWFSLQIQHFKLNC